MMTFQDRYYKNQFAFAFLLFLIPLFSPKVLVAQASFQVTITGGNATTTCTDNFGSPDPRWRVQVAGGNWVVYPFDLFCFNDPPMLQYVSQSYDCPLDAPQQLEVCFNAFEDDGSFCNINPTCSESICQYFILPWPGTSLDYHLELPPNLSSGGFVDFTIDATGSFLGSGNDLPCGAIDMGTLQNGQVLGDASLSNYDNLCASNFFEPNPSDFGWFINDRGVWHTFTTSANPGSLIEIYANSDPEMLGDYMSIELALYESSDGSCTGNFQLINQSSVQPDWDEYMRLECLKPNTTYYLLVDAAWINNADIEGIFGLEIRDSGAEDGADFMCDAPDMGEVPENGSVAATGQSNFCSTDIGESEPSAFIGQRTVWYSFQAPSSGHILIETISNLFPPAGIDPINLQIALYTTSNGDCNGNLIEVQSQYNASAYDEVMQVECLNPGQTYWVLIDGAGDNTVGIFDISISDAGDLPPHFTTNIAEVLCFGETIQIGDSTFTANGNVNEILTASNGCDSLVIGTVTILPEVHTYIDTILCSGNSLQVGNNIYYTSGNHEDILIAESGCDSLVSSVIVVPPLLTVDASMTQEASGYLLSDGAAMATPNGGSGNYIIEWSDGQQGSVANNLQGGLTYCVTVTDNIGCTAEDCALVFFPSNILTTLTNDTLDCIGDVDGTLNLSISNGAWPYDFQWESNTGNLNGSGTVVTEGGSSSVNNLPAGTYSFTISDGFGFSSAIGEVVNPEPIITNIDTVLCFGSTLLVGNTTYNSSGSINELLSSSKGCDSTVIGNLTILPMIETNLQESICEGDVLMVGSSSYTQSGPISELLTASNGCDSLVSGILTVIPPVVTNLDSAVCHGGSIIIGTSIYNQSGNYTNNFIAANGCDSIVQTSFTVYDELQVEVDVVNEASALFAADGMATAAVSGGSGMFSYLWSNGQLTQQANNLVGGTNYCVTVTDELGCTAEACKLILFPVNILSDFNIRSVDCNGGTDGQIIFSAYNGQAPYNYLWENLSNGQSGSGQIMAEGGTAVLNQLAAGNYSITIADPWGIGIFPVTVDEPDPLEVFTLSIISPICYGDCDATLEIEIMGGMPPYYFADGSPVNSATIILDQLCGDELIDQSFMDANGCSIQLQETISNPPEFLAEATETQPVTCFGESDGQATVTTNGDAVNYLWDNGETTATAVNLEGDIHSVTVTNTEGCEAIATVYIEAPLQPLTSSISLLEPISCDDSADGSISATASGGEGLAYLWNTGDTTAVLANLTEGNYGVTITDENGCSTIDSYILEAPPPIIAILEKQDVNCPDGASSGLISVSSVTGGVPPYLYSLNGSTLTANNTFGQLTSGAYEIIIEDANGCAEIYDMLIEDPDLLIVELGDERTVELGKSLVLNPTTNNPNVTFSWSPLDSLACPGCAQQEVAPLFNTTYSVTVTDPLSGCTSSDEVLVKVLKDRDVFIPNIFTPNNDGMNDRFMIYADKSVRIVRSFSIFNRWGALVFEASNFDPHDQQSGWNGFYRGKQAPSGVYVYAVDIEFLDGVRELLRGDITLMK